MRGRLQLAELLVVVPVWLLLQPLLHILPLPLKLLKLLELVLVLLELLDATLFLSDLEVELPVHGVLWRR